MWRERGQQVILLDLHFAFMSLDPVGVVDGGRWGVDVVDGGRYI